ncbi:MAG: ABC transporter ATP-binding protein [Burkholderiales bacterium]|nr:ABC transporter ATP-binding protein [Burkholderiales bacterium]OJX08353.1 MAG: ABC transporter [Burkholderiales bacterium 70-64]
MAAMGVSIRQVQKKYASAQHGEVLALSDCSIDIRPNEFFVLVGPSGCGKTTLLNVIAGFDTLTAGTVALGDRLISAPDVRLGPGPDRMVVFQHGGLFPWMTVLENVCYGPVVQGQMGQAEAREKARSMLAMVGLAGIERRYPGEVSSGMRRRVEIMRALIGRPQILLMDEPFRALDAITKAVVQDFLLRLFDTHPHTVFFITHDLIEALFLGDRVGVMTTRPGRVKTVFDVDIPRPRSTRVLASEEFLRLKRDVTDAVHDEAIKAFEAGEREAAR